MTFAACREKLVEFAEPIVVLEWRRFRRKEMRVSVALVAFLQLVAFGILSQCATPGEAGSVLEYGSLVYLALAALIVTSYGSRSIKQERTLRTWEGLAVTPLTSRQIADQKMLAATIPVLPWLICGLPMAVAVVIMGGASIAQAAVLGVMLVVGALLASAITIDSSGTRGFLDSLHMRVVASVMLIGLVMPHVFAGSAIHIGRDMTSDPLSLCLFVLVIALLSCGLLAALLTPLIGKRFPKGHPRRRRALRMLNVSLLCGAAIYLIPAIRDWALQVFWVVIGFVWVCVSPIAAVRELFGENMSIYRDILPHGLPRYGVIVGTLVVQMSAFLAFRSTSATSIERLRRTA